MAKRQERQEYTNPEVRFERADIEFRAVIYFGVVLSVSVLLVIITMTWYGYILMKQSDKKSTMAPAYIDKENRAPSIALEALEDIRDRDAGKPRGPMLFPPRAAEYYAPQKKLLADGGPASSIDSRFQPGLEVYDLKDNQLAANRTSDRLNRVC